MMLKKSNNINSSPALVILLMLYFLFAPLEDILTGSIGTVAKYLAIGIIIFGCIGNGFHLVMKASTINICLIYLMFVSLLSVLWSIDQKTSLDRIVAYLLLPGLCLFISMMEFSQKEYELIISSAIIGGIFASLLAYSSGITMNTHGIAAGRLILTDTNDPNNFAALLFLPATLVLDRIHKKRNKILYVLVFLLFVLVILLTGSRGAFIALLAMMLVYFTSIGKHKRITMMVTLIALLAFLFILITIFLPKDLFQRMFSFANYDTGAGRTEVWKLLIAKVLPDMDLWGLGAGCASVALTPYFGYAKGVHNTYLNMIGEFGILGIWAFIYMLVLCIKNSRIKRYHVDTALIFGMCIIIFFLDSYAKKFFWNTVLLVMIHDGVISCDDNKRDFVRYGDNYEKI